ncbi:MAG TPA: hypothetical protein VHC44_13770 [Verrucomicrobiae bacterium]|nr:hypothetical protein [Verrucomicrobiae bacterium]
MKTRIGKIAQLPKSIRDDLNHRLNNGHQSPELLKWLNGLPETKELLAEKFDHQPITKSNLSDWRHGGFEDWRQDQLREARIQRISETGESLEQAETGDLFENFARIAVAELMADLDGLSKLRGEKRSQYLHSLVRDLARLQNAYNRSRWADLAWTKYNHSRTGASPVRTDESELTTHNSQLPNSSPTTSVVPDRAQSCSGEKHDSPPRDPLQIIHHTKCHCGEPCPKCHAPDSAYPLDEVLRDKEFYKKDGRHPYARDGHQKFLVNCDCDCPCERCENAESALRADPNGRVALPRDPIIPHEPMASDENPSSPEPPTRPADPLNPLPLTPHPSHLDPLNDFLRKMSHLKTVPH